jgi:conjugative transfer signal peptidase TraF
MTGYRLIGIGAFLAAGTILGAFEVFGLTLNTTPSYPRGLWRRVEVAHPPVIRGRMALACPPRSAAFDEAVRRGYMGRRGSCPNDYRPIMKRIMAVAGDVVDFDGARGAMRVNGQEIPNSARQFRDAAGRPMTPWVGGIIPPGQALMVSDYDPYSFDGRYYGPLPEASIYAYTEPVLTIP